MSSPISAIQRAQRVRQQMPDGGLFAGQEFRIAPAPFALDPALLVELEFLGRVLLQFNRAVNLLYRQSAAGKQPSWVAAYLDQGKPEKLLQWQRSPAFKNEVPRVIRPDLLLTETGFVITELDSVPGGIGLTAWLNQTYDSLPPMAAAVSGQPLTPGFAADSGRGDSMERIIGGAREMIEGFESIFGDAERVHLTVSEESATYRPEMEWIAREMDPGRFHVRDSAYADFAPGDAVYRFFELFDLPNVANGERIMELAAQKSLYLTPPPKPIFEEKMLFALLWNRNLRGFWRQELGERFLARLLEWVPYTWVVDPAPLPPHGAIPELNLTDWHQLKAMSQRERELILKVSGFSENAWGARGVSLGSDLSTAEWTAAVDRALESFGRTPYVLQRYHKPRTVGMNYADWDGSELARMDGRVRLCPYYFVAGQAEAARARLGGVLATICPPDKKIIHGMKDAILAPCAAGAARD